jgi:hypothetical protein
MPVKVKSKLNRLKERVMPVSQYTLTCHTFWTKPSLGKAKERVITSFITFNMAAHVNWTKLAQRTCATTLLILHLGLSQLWKAKRYCPKTSSKQPSKISTAGATEPKTCPNWKVQPPFFKFWAPRPYQPTLASKTTKSPWVVTENNRNFEFFLQLLLQDGTKGLTTLPPCPHTPYRL